MHPHLVVQLAFARVPEIHDGFRWKVFVAKATIAQEVVDRATEELGLARSLPVPGAGALEYVLEEVWTDGQTERTSYFSFFFFFQLRFLRCCGGGGVDGGLSPSEALSPPLPRIFSLLSLPPY